MLGRMISAPWFDASHRLLFSQSDYIYGTSRSAAMGGAFASLGADLSSMSINPAGLGMYQSSDAGFTQALSIDGMKTSAEFMRPGALSQGGIRTSYGLNNIGVAFNLHNGSGRLTSVTMGFNYNRAANFNSHTTISTTGENASIVEMFHNQMNFLGASPDLIGSPANPFANENLGNDKNWASLWGAMMGYRTGLLGHNGDNYTISSGFNPSDSNFDSVTRGGLYEYNFSVGFNVSNLLYLGATLGATHVNYREDNTYREVWPTGTSIGNSMEYNQSTRITGSGITAKFGAIARPTPSLRIGVAVHLPTWQTIDKSYTSSMSAGGGYSTSGEPLVDRQNLNTAPRLLAGISGVIADRAIVALDYDVAWYDKIHVRNVDAGKIADSKAESRSLYKPAHTFRAGVEFSVSDPFSIRAGGSYMMDFFRNKSYVSEGNPSVMSAYNLTAGVGFKIGRNGYIDVAYIYNRSRYTGYDFYYYNDTAGDLLVSQYDTAGDVNYDRKYSQHRNHHMITLTLGNRF